MYTPCPPGEAGALAMTMYTLPDPSKLFAPKVEIGDFMLALTKVKPTVDKKMLKTYEDWTEEFGQDG